jgi:Zn-dependent peptidase ImmA (M78 family)/DNA-binding XRE family transcriptional regulator
LAAFNPTRLTLTRKRNGWTKAKLAGEIGVTARSVSAYEAGDQQPSALTVARLADKLGFPRDFFFGEDIDDLSLEAASFRGLAKTSQKQKDQATACAELAFVWNDWIEARFELPDADVPKLPEGVTPETAAEIVRTEWGLGERPIKNMIYLLEKHGVRVFALAEESRNVDGFSFWRWPTGTPYVFLDMTKTAERSRMDAAHELGHLVMHSSHDCPPQQAEREAKAFASAFLMPAGSVLASAPRDPDVRDIVKAKRQWNVSASALTVRMHKLGLLTDWEYHSLFKRMNAMGILTAEVNGCECESSQVLDKVFRALRAEGITKADVAAELHLPLHELDRLVFRLVLTRLDGGGEEVSHEAIEQEAVERRKTFRLA